MTSAFAEDQIVKINGAIISGQIVSEDGDAVVLSIRGIELRIPKSEIREIVRDEEDAPAPAGASESGSSAPVVEMPEIEGRQQMGTPNGRVGQPSSTGRHHSGGD